MKRLIYSVLINGFVLNRNVTSATLLEVVVLSSVTIAQLQEDHISLTVSVHFLVVSMTQKIAVIMNTTKLFAVD